MDFAMLPPEINSARMYAGVGSGPMLAAAEAWNGLAAELHAAAGSYQSVISTLTAGPWAGPASAAMAAAASTYVSWLHTTATQAEQTAVQAKAAAAAYQAAFSSTVPPPIVAANRSLLMQLVTSNLFGQNTAAIAANEAQYAQMWAQDAAAMYTYAGSSAAATTLSPFTPPQQTIDPGGAAGQATAVGQAAGNSTGNAQSVIASIQQAFSAVPNALQSLTAAAPAAAAPAQTPVLNTLNLISDLVTIFLDLPADLVGIFVAIPLSVVALVTLPFDIGSYLVSAHTDDIVSGWNGEESWPGTGPAPVTEFPARITNFSPATVSAPALSAGLGEANTVGALSVPPTWTIATPAVRPVAYTLPTLPSTGVAPAAADPAEGGSGRAFGEMALAGMAGRAMAGTVGTGAGGDGGKRSAGKRLPARADGGATTGDNAATNGGKAETDNDVDTAKSKPRTVVTGVAAELREFAKLRDEGILTDEEFTEQKNRLLGR